jgi:hypothetical protein
MRRTNSHKPCDPTDHAPNDRSTIREGLAVRWQLERTQVPCGASWPSKSPTFKRSLGAIPWLPSWHRHPELGSFEVLVVSANLLGGLAMRALRRKSVIALVCLGLGMLLSTVFFGQLQIQKVGTGDPVSVTKAFFTSMAEGDTAGTVQLVAPAQRKLFHCLTLNFIPCTPLLFEHTVNSRPGRLSKRPGVHTC